MRRLVMFLVLFVLGAAVPALATPTTGGVTWRDTRTISHPGFYPLDIRSGGTDLYAKMSGGSGTTCSSGSPCSWATALGKTNGSTTYNIYIQGTGAHGNNAIVGAAGAEVVIRPWPAGSPGCSSVCGVTFTGRNDLSANMKYVVYDGGPGLDIHFQNNNPDNFGPSMYFNASAAGTHDHITFYRTDWSITATGEHIAVWGRISNMCLINSEFHAELSTDPDNPHHVYMSGASNFGSSTDFCAYNNVFRDTAGEAFEFRLFETWSNVTIEGNLFINTTTSTCATWGCQGTIILTNDSGSYGGTWRIAYNVFADTGGPAIQTCANPSTTQIYNNTFYNWGQGTGGSGTWGSVAAGNCSGTFNKAFGVFKNNLFQATGTYNGTARVPFPGNASPDGSNWTADHNGCTSSSNCGTSKVTISSASFASTSESSASYLALASGSTPIDAGTTVTTTTTTDYLGNTQVVNGTRDIGAMEFGAGAADTTNPDVAITAPATGTYSTSTSPLTTLAGTCSDDTAVSSVSWSNSAGGSGSATGTTSWSVSSISLSSGSNAITVTCTDSSSNTDTDTLTVTYTPPASGGARPRLFRRFRVSVDDLLLTPGAVAAASLTSLPPSPKRIVNRMPMYDRVCQTCAHVKVDSLERIADVAPIACPACQGEMTRGFVGRANGVIADEIPGGIDVPHGICNDDGTPRRYYSKSEMRRAAAAKGLVNIVTHVTDPTSGSDKNKFTTRWI